MIAVRLLVEGATIREAVFPGDSLTIGRGPNSDFVIGDPSVSRRHALVRRDESGRLWIEDAGSRNGLRVGGRRVDRTELTPGRPLRLALGTADVELALLSTEATVELPASGPGPGFPWRVVKALAFWAAGIAGWVAVLVLAPTFWSPWEQERMSSVSGLALSAAVGLPVTAFLLIGLFRIAGRKSRLGDGLRALAVVSWGWVVLTLLTHVASYGLGVAAHGALSTFLRSAGLIVTVAYLASVARHARRRRFFLAWVAAIGVLVLAVHAVGRLAARQAGIPQVDYQVAMPVAGVAGPATDLDRYLGGVRDGFGRARERAEEERRRLEATPP